MPGLIGNAGDVLLVGGIAKDEAVLPAVDGQPFICLLAHKVCGKAQLVLAGAGQGHGFQRLGVGFLMGHALVLIFLGPQFQNLNLLLVGTVSAV